MFCAPSAQLPKTLHDQLRRWLPLANAPMTTKTKPPQPTYAPSNKNSLALHELRLKAIIVYEGMKRELPKGLKCAMTLTLEPFAAEHVSIVTNVDRLPFTGVGHEPIVLSPLTFVWHLWSAFLFAALLCTPHSVFPPTMAAYIPGARIMPVIAACLCTSGARLVASRPPTSAASHAGRLRKPMARSGVVLEGGQHGSRGQETRGHGARALPILAVARRTLSATPEGGGSQMISPGASTHRDVPAHTARQTGSRLARLKP